MKTIKVYVAIATVVSAFAFAPLAFAGDEKQPQCGRECVSGHEGGDIRGHYSLDANANAHSDSNSSAWAQGGAGGSAVNANANNAQNNNNVTSTGGTATNANNNNANNSSNATGGAGGLGGSGGAGGAGGSATNDNTNSANNSSNATGGSSSANDNGNNNGNNNSSSSNSQSQSQSADNTSDNSNSNNSSQDVSVNSNYQRAPVSTAYAAPLAVGEDTCMGSSSMGAQAVGFGISLGSTWQDRNCQRLKNSRQLVALGYQRAATSLMCVDVDVRHAMEQADTPCPTGPVEAEAIAPTAPYAQEEPSDGRADSAPTASAPRPPSPARRPKLKQQTPAEAAPGNRGRFRLCWRDHGIDGSAGSGSLCSATKRAWR